MSGFFVAFKRAEVSSLALLRIDSGSGLKLEITVVIAGFLS